MAPRSGAVPAASYDPHRVDVTTNGGRHPDGRRGTARRTAERCGPRHTRDCRSGRGRNNACADSAPLSDAAGGSASGCACSREPDGRLSNRASWLALWCASSSMAPPAFALP
jgi:hypothetical protein